MSELEALLLRTDQLTSPSERDDKLRGGYYTPEIIAKFLARWAVQNVGANVLEPSCGNGQLISALTSEYGNSINIVGVELFASEAAQARLRGNKHTKIINSDAFSWFIKTRPYEMFDAVVGNPPFIKYQNFPEQYRTIAFQIMKEEGLSPSRLTNAWAPFIVLATRALKIGGRFAFVLPAELLQVTYASEVRKYLSTKYKNISIVTFKKLVFAGIQQETVLVLGEREDCLESNISFLEFEGLNDLEDESFTLKKESHKILDINHDNEKWTQYYLSGEELNLIRAIEKSKKFLRLGDIADVDVGVVTGNNDFFILNKEQAEAFKISEYCSPVVSRSAHMPGILFKKGDHNNVTKKGDRNLLLSLGKIPRAELTKDLLNYIKKGEKEGVTEGYKCRIRLPSWWAVPSMWKPDAFLLRQIHEGPRIISNETKSTSTDTIHRVRIKAKISPEILAAASVNSLTFAMSEIRGRSYGGGVLELEPTEAENLLLPFINSETELPVEEIDKLIREKQLIKALDLVDSILLKNLGLTKKDIGVLRGIWFKLKTRRTSRNRK